MSTHVRPGPLRWLWYTFGGGLPARYAPWVLHDTTGPTCWLRQVLRSLVYLAPFVVAGFVLVPGPAYILVGACCGGTFMALLFSLAFMEGTTEHRLVKAGFASGYGNRVRQERSAAAEQVRNAALRRRNEKRYARRAAP